MPTQKPTLLWLLSLLICSYTWAKGGKVIELNSSNYEQSTKGKVVFINFNRPTCDLAQYYNDDIEVIARRLPQVDIFYLDKTKCPQVESKYDLYGADMLTCVKDGKVLEDYDGHFSYNLVEEWVYGLLNQHTGTNYKVKKYRAKPTYGANSGENVEEMLLAKFLFDGNGIDSKTGDEKFPLEPNQGARFVGNTLQCGGKYTGDNTLQTSSMYEMSYKNFSFNLDFNPKDTERNVLLKIGYATRWFGVSIYENKLAINFDNGSWIYLLNETTVTPEKWHNLICAIDVEQRIVRVMLDGKRLDDLLFDEDVSFEWIAEKWTQDKQFCFMSWGNGQLFEGFVDNLFIYDDTLTGQGMQNVYNSKPKK